MSHDHFLSFEKAREYVQNLKLKDTKDWENFCHSRNKPDNIPGFPHLVYKNEWRGWDDWIRGKGITHFQNKIPKLDVPNKSNSKYLSFEQARQFVHKLGLKKIKDWENYSDYGEKPDTIPSNPGVIYQKEWEGWLNWFGIDDDALEENSNKSEKDIPEKLPTSMNEQKSTFLSFEQAKEFIRSLNLKTERDWWDYASSGSKPSNIPLTPWKVYSNEWLGFQDWIGVKKHIKTKFLSFEQAKDYVRKLGLKSAADWNKFRISGKKPSNIPSAPNNTYKKEWKGWGDWLGTGRIDSRKIKYVSFEQARDHVRKLGLKDRKEWKKFCMSKNKPYDIPRDPHIQYAKEWKGWGDWLKNTDVENLFSDIHELEDTTTRSLNDAIGELRLKYLPFNQARDYVRNLGLRSRMEWKKLDSSKNRPDNIPPNPKYSYRKEWKGWDDWLGIERVNDEKTKYLSFEQAKNYVRNLRLKNHKEWLQFNSKNRPDNIPSAPHIVYKKHWKGWGDWLGTGTRSWGHHDFLSFDEAKKYVKTLNLKNEKEWKKFCKSGKKPNSIPSNPRNVYWGNWQSWADWLGHTFETFEDARKYVRSLHLKNQMEWKAFCSSYKKPDEIPYEPWKVYSVKWKGWDDWFMGN